MVPSLLTLFWLGMAGSCGPRTLIAVDPCSDGGATFSSFPSCPSVDGAVAERSPSSLRVGLVGLWHLDDGVGSTVAVDSSGLAVPNAGMLKDLDANAAWVRGQLGGALETKAAGYVLVKPSASIDSIVDQVTIGAWIYLEGTITDYATALSRQIGYANASGYTQHYHLSLNAEGRPSAFINRSVPDDFFRRPMAPTPVTPMTWTHLAVTYDGSAARLYVDGTLVVQLPITGQFGTDTTPILLGGNVNAGSVTERFPGRIDEIVLYNRALSESEIGQLAAGATF